MIKIEFLKLAKDDIKSIRTYFDKEAGSEIAKKIVNGIRESIRRLEKYPDSGCDTPDEELNKQGYQMVISGKYAAIYRVINDKVYIYHIANTQMDYTNFF